MKTALEGLVALMKLWSAENQALLQIAQDVEIIQSGATVESRYQGQTQDLLDVVDELYERFLR